MVTFQRQLRVWTSRSDDRGAAMVEYAFLMILIAIVAFVAVGLVGEELSTTYGDIAGCIDPSGC